MAEKESFVGFHDAFKYLDTYGLPLAMCMDACEKHGLRVAADSFVYDALIAGWSWEKSLATVQEAWADKYGSAKSRELIAILSHGCAREIAYGKLNRWRGNQAMSEKGRGR